MSDINAEQNYTVGRGRVFFDRFLPGTNRGTGERYLGNTPEFSPTNETEMLDHYSSESGINEKDASVLLQADQNGSFTCDHISLENLALFFLGDVESRTTVATTEQISVFADALKGRWFQLGSSSELPTGIRHVDNVVIGYAAQGVDVPDSGDISTIDGVEVVPLQDNAEVDLRNGRLFVESDAPDIPAGVQLVVQFDIKAQSRTMVINKNNMVYGALRYISDNPVGENRVFFYPKVSLAPDGEYALKGDEWQTMSFTFQGLRMGNRQTVYIDTPDDDVVEDDGEAQYSISVSVSDNTQTVGESVAVTATVRDSFNNVVPDVLVTFTASSVGSVTPGSGTTNTSGVVTTTLTATAAGSTVVTATAAGFNGSSSSVTFED